MDYARRNALLAALGFDTYEDYLASPRWLELSTAARGRAENRCQLCNQAGKGHVHHRSYGRLGTPDEARDLILLCASCHGKFHGIPSAGPSVAPTRPTAIDAVRIKNRNRYDTIHSALVDLGGSGTTSQIAFAGGISTGQAGAWLGLLRKRKFIGKRGKIWHLPGSAPFNATKPAKPKSDKPKPRRLSDLRTTTAYTPPSDHLLPEFRGRVKQ